MFKISERLEILEGQLCRIVTAYASDKKHKGEKMDVLRIFEDGRKAIRNIEYKGIGGWLIAWPGYTYYHSSYGYNCGSFVAELDPWYSVDAYEFKNFSYHHPTDAEKELILQKYPEFKWIFKKANLTTEEIFHILPEWKAHPQQVELLLGAGYPTLALNKNIYKLKNQRQILEWLKNNPGNKYITLAEIQKCLKWGIDLEELHHYEYQNCRGISLPYDCWKYMHTVLMAKAAKKETATIVQHHYKDYLEMAKKAGHNLQENYWRFPKDLNKAHKKVMNECAKIDAVKKAEERKKKQKEYTAAIEKMAKKMFQANKLNVFIPATIEQIEKQATALDQCLIRCDYVQKVIKHECFLVFIEKNGKPYATCELKPKGKKFTIGQFYGDESKKNYFARPDAKAALNEWATANKVKIIEKAAA